MNKPFDPTKPVRTVDGRPARILATDLKGTECPIVAAVPFENGQEYLLTVKSDGRAIWPRAEKDSLVNIPGRIQRELWINVYPGRVGMGHDGSRKSADDGAGVDRIACVRFLIDCEEGEGL